MPGFIAFGDLMRCPFCEWGEVWFLVMWNGRSLYECSRCLTVLDRFYFVFADPGLGEWGDERGGEEGRLEG